MFQLIVSPRMECAVRAVVYEGPGDVQLVERFKPERLGPGDVLLEVVACGLCGTDQRVMAVPPLMGCEAGRTIGHEISARVSDAGDASHLEVGDLVVLAPNYPCRQCPSCRAGLLNLCDDFRHVGSGVDGGLADYLVAPAEFLHKVPAGVDPVLAALAEPLACVLNGAERAQWTANSPVVILGGGPIGLLYLAVARLSGASPIVVSEPTPARAQRARDLGADAVVDPRSDSHVDELIALTGGGARVVVDTLGTLLGTAAQVAAKRGQILVFGIDETATASVVPSLIVSKELSLDGVYLGRGTFPWALRLLRDHPELFARIVSDVVPLDEWTRAQELLLTGAAAGKILVTP